jgi:hypothetical protein
MNKEDYLLELTELSYDRSQLKDIFDAVKSHARIKGLPWRGKPGVNLDTEKAKCLVIQHGEHMMLDSTKAHLSYNLLTNDYIKSLVSKINFGHKITEHNIDIIWYRPGFVFEPHTDAYSHSTLMWPIYPDGGGAPIDFYHRDGIEIKLPGEYKNIVTDNDIIYTHYYSTEYPTVFNSHRIHGVKSVNEDRVYLRLRLNESFDELLTKYKNGELINDR